MYRMFFAMMQQKSIRILIVTCLCFVVAGSALVLLKPSSIAHAQSSRLAIGSETLVYDHNTLVNKGLSGWTDSPIGCLAAGSSNIDCYSANGGAYQGDATTKTSGTTTDPAQTVVYNHLSITNEPGGVYNYASISSIYKDPSSGTLIGFVHLERWPGGNGGLFWASIGLAYSKDNGTTWNWVGEIIQHNMPYNSSNPQYGYEASVGAYILHTENGVQYFYVYVYDANADGSGGTTVSRASVQQVVDAVNNGTVLPTFYKYYNGGWSSQAAWINGTSGTPQGGPGTDVLGLGRTYNVVDSIIWDGALGQYVAGIRGYDQGYLTVDLITSANPLDFSTPDGATRYEIVSPTQAVYPTLIGDPANPELQANADGSFYLYYDTLATGQGFNFNNTSLSRRQVTVSTTGVSTSYQASSDFSGAQGQNQWNYTDSTDGEQSFPAMNWDSVNSRWQGSEQYCQIGSNWQHPGVSCDSVRLWQAPIAGTVTIGANGNLAVAASCSSNPGVDIRILKNGSQIWPASGWQLLAHGASYTFPSGITTTVNGGDELEFVVAHAGSDNYCDTTTWDASISYTNSLSVPENGFETPTVGAGNFQYQPGGSSWTFTAGTGIAGNGSGFTSGNPNAPEGQQVAFLQNQGTTISQLINGWQANTTYTITFSAAQRGNGNNGGQDFQVIMDSTVLGTIKPSGTSYQNYSVTVTPTTGPQHTIIFKSVDSAGGDNTALIDNVRVTF